MDNKKLALSALSLCGAFRLGEMLSSRRLLALTYHRVVPREQCPGGKRPANTHFTDEFDEQMAYVARRFRVPSGNELRAFLETGVELPRYSLAITFDDGYENNFTHALPILRRHGLHAFFFVTTNLVGDPGRMPWFDRLERLLSDGPLAETLKRLRRLDPAVPDASDKDIFRHFKTLAHARQSEMLDALERETGDAASRAPDGTLYGMMSWDQVRSLAAAGMTIGSHSANHQILAAVAPHEARAELLSSRLRVERETGQPCWCFAYPNGERRDFRLEDEASAEAAGYLCAFTQIPGSISRAAPRYALPRIPIPETGDMKIFRCHVSGVQRLFRAIFPQ